MEVLNICIVFKNCFLNYFLVNQIKKRSSNSTLKTEWNPVFTWYVCIKKGLVFGLFLQCIRSHFLVWWAYWVTKTIKLIFVFTKPLWNEILTDENIDVMNKFCYSCNTRMRWQNEDHEKRFVSIARCLLLLNVFHFQASLFHEFASLNEHDII